MISPSEPDYQETKQIIMGTRSMSRKASSVAENIFLRFGVNPINVFFDQITPDNRNRVSVIFRTEKEALQFRDVGGFNFDNDKQSEVVSLLKESSFIYKLNPVYWKKTLVIFTAFDSVARSDVYHTVAKEKMFEAVKMLVPNLWHIEHMIAYPAIFLPTETDVQALGTDTKKIIISKLHSLLKECDFCGCFDDPPFVQFDSKENFETNYQSNWFYYSRDH